MSKAAQKRFRKELGKMLSAGRYWEWLEVLEKESAVADYRREWQEAWQTLARRALRDPQHMEDFLTRSGSLQQHPDISETQFLFLLKEFIQKDAGGEKLASLKGLSFPGEAIRRQAISGGNEPFPEERFRKNLSALLSKPGEVTQKNYEEIARLVQGTALAIPVRYLGGRVTAMRSVARHPSNEDGLAKLSDIELALKEAARNLSPHLQRVLFYPFLFHIEKVIQPLLETRQEAIIATIVSSVPYLFGLLAGERAEGIKRQLSPLNRELPDGVSLEKIIHGSDFDEKIRLLGRMRSSHAEKDERGGFLDDFLDLYRSIFSDIQRMGQSLSERERKDLGRVMGSALTKDIHHLWNGLMATEHDLVGILLSAAQSACLDRRLSLLSILLAEKQGQWRLKVLAEGFIKGQPCPNREDIFWLFEEFSEILFPRVSSLKPLLILWQSESPFLNDMAQQIWSKALTVLVLNSLSKKVDGLFPLPLDGPMNEEVKRQIQIFRKELNTLRGCKPLGNVADFLDCFPDDCFTESGYHRLLGIMFERGRGLDSIIEMMDGTLRHSPISKGMNQFLPVDLFGNYFRAQEKGFYAFLRERWEGLKTTSLQSIEKLAGILLRKETRPEDRNLLLRVGNLLEERFRNGEKEAGLLKERLMGELTKKSPEPARAPSRKGKRRPKGFW